MSKSKDHESEPMMDDFPEVCGQTGGDPSHDECIGTKPTGDQSGDSRRTCALLSLGVCMFVGVCMLAGERFGLFIGAHDFRGDARDVDEHASLATAAEMPSIDQDLLAFLSESSFGRQIVIDILVNEYAIPDAKENLSKEGRESSETDRLENAIDAIQISETDSEPVQVRGHPFLFVGSVESVQNQEALHRNGITHIIGWSPTARCNDFDEIHYLCIPNILQYNDLLDNIDVLDQAVEYIEAARLAGGRAMSHCWYGRERSVTLFVAYMMKYEGLDSAAALQLIQKARPPAASYLDVIGHYKQLVLKQQKKSHHKQHGHGNH